jgi:hypothetical protein
MSVNLLLSLSSKKFNPQCFDSTAITRFIKSEYYEKQRVRKRRKVDRWISGCLSREEEKVLNRHKLLNALGRYSLSKYGLTQIKSQSRLFMRERIIKGLLGIPNLPGTISIPLLSEGQFMVFCKSFLTIANSTSAECRSVFSRNGTVRDLEAVQRESLKKVRALLSLPPYFVSEEDTRFIKGVRSVTSFEDNG